MGLHFFETDSRLSGKYYQKCTPGAFHTFYDLLSCGSN